MKKDTIRESAREEQSTKRAFTAAAKSKQLLATFFCASKIAYTHSAKLEKKKAIKHKYHQIYTLKDNLTILGRCVVADKRHLLDCDSDKFSSLIQNELLP